MKFSEKEDTSNTRKRTWDESLTALKNGVSASQLVNGIEDILEKLNTLSPRKNQKSFAPLRNTGSNIHDLPYIFAIPNQIFWNEDAGMGFSKEMEAATFFDSEIEFDFSQNFAPRFIRPIPYDTQSDEDSASKTTKENEEHDDLGIESFQASNNCRMPFMDLTDVEAISDALIANDTNAYPPAIHFSHCTWALICQQWRIKNLFNAHNVVSVLQSSHMRSFGDYILNNCLGELLRQGRSSGVDVLFKTAKNLDIGTEMLLDALFETSSMTEKDSMCFWSKLERLKLGELGDEGILAETYLCTKYFKKISKVE